MPFIGVLSSNDIWTTLPVNFEICGYEEVTPAIDAIMSLTTLDLLPLDADIEIDLHNLFLNDDRDALCPIVNFTLTDVDSS